MHGQVLDGEPQSHEEPEERRFIRSYLFPSHPRPINPIIPHRANNYSPSTSHRFPHRFPMLRVTIHCPMTRRPSCSIHAAIRRREFMSGSLKTALEPLVVVTRSFPSRTMPSADLHTSPLAQSGRPGGPSGPNFLALTSVRLDGHGII